MLAGSVKLAGPGLLLTLLPLAAVFLPTGVGKGTFRQGHGGSLRKKRMATIRNRESSVMRSGNRAFTSRAILPHSGHLKHPPPPLPPASTSAKARLCLLGSEVLS